MTGRILTGTSGWHYGHWAGPFYPHDLPHAEWLDFYMQRFGTVEINNTFYRLPEKDVLREWRDRVGKDFVFSIKASRYITHMKKLKDPPKSLEKFFSRIGALGDSGGPVLFQLPGRFRFNAGRLEAFLEALPGGRRYAFEFRDRSWENDETYRMLSDRGTALCVYDMEGRTSPREVTGDFVYVRLHGPGRAYEGSYDAKALSGWAGAFSTWASKGLDVFCYFDNDQNGYAALDATRLQEMIRG